MNAIDYAEIARLVRKGRRAEKRGKAWTRFATSIVYAWLVYMWRGWMLTLAVGVTHHEWLPSMPTLGYWWAVVIVVLLVGVFSVVPPLKKDGETR